MARLNLVAIHGIGNHKDGWSYPWEQYVAEQTGKTVYTYEATWDYLRKKQDRVSTGLANYSGDISAIWDDDVLALCHDRIRSAVSDPGPTWVMGHSLGTVLAWRVLSEWPPKGTRVRRLITTGSPLHKLEQRGTITRVRWPRGVIPGEWRNVWSVVDPVCFAPWWTQWKPSNWLIAGKVGVASNRMALCGHGGYLRTAAMKWAVRT